MYKEDNRKLKYKKDCTIWLHNLYKSGLQNTGPLKQNLWYVCVRVFFFKKNTYM